MSRNLFYHLILSMFLQEGKDSFIDTVDREKEGEAVLGKAEFELGVNQVSLGTLVRELSSVNLSLLSFFSSWNSPLLPCDKTRTLTNATKKKPHESWESVIG